VILACRNQVPAGEDKHGGAALPFLPIGKTPLAARPVPKATTWKDNYFGLFFNKIVDFSITLVYIYPE
jgi:hypothetical protein